MLRERNDDIGDGRAVQSYGGSASPSPKYSMVSSRVGSWAATTPNATQAIMQRGLRSFGPGRWSGAES